jgi:TPR repeat protein
VMLDRRDESGMRRRRRQRDRFEFSLVRIRAVMGGDLRALYSLAEAWMLGRHFGLRVRRDPRRAAWCYEAAARGGIEDAQYELGFGYLLGEGVERDVDAGVRWLTAAAEQDHVDAIRVLVDGFSTGVFGIEPDAAMAQRWSERLSNHLARHPEHRRPSLE